MPRVTTERRSQDEGVRKARLAEGEKNRAVGLPLYRSAPPSWIADARRAARCVRPSAEQGAYCVYVVLLFDHRRPAGRWGLYVGETSKSASVRFAEHIDAGALASRHVARFGVRLLPRFTLHLQKLSRAEAKQREREVHAAISTVCDWVEGGR